jgi:hypothetical protein
MADMLGEEAVPAVVAGQILGKRELERAEKKVQEKPSASIDVLDLAQDKPSARPSPNTAEKMVGQSREGNAEIR